MKATLWIVGLLAGGFLVMMVVEGVKETNDTRSPWQKVSDSCEKEFKGRGEMLINDCKIRIGSQRISDRERDALSRAEKGAR